MSRVEHTRGGGRRELPTKVRFSSVRPTCTHVPVHVTGVLNLILLAVYCIVDISIYTALRWQMTGGWIWHAIQYREGEV